MKKYTVTESKEVILDGKKFLLEEGDEIAINETIQPPKIRSTDEALEVLGLQRGYTIEDLDRALENTDNELAQEAYTLLAKRIGAAAKSSSQDPLSEFKWENPTQYSIDDGYSPWAVKIELQGYGTHFELDGVEYRNYYHIMGGKYNALDFAKSVSERVPYEVTLSNLARTRARFKNGRMIQESPSLHKFYSNITPEQEEAWKTGGLMPESAY